MYLGQFDEAIHSLTVANDENPQTGRDPLTHRAMAYILRGDDEKGKSELKLISDSNRTSYASYILAHLYVSQGELEAYRKLCDRMDRKHFDWGVRISVLGPNAVADFAPLIESARKQQNEHPGQDDTFYFLNYGLVLYRAGRFEEALQQFVKSSEGANNHKSTSLGWYARAMTFKQLNRENEAIECLEKADAAADTVFAQLNQADWQARVLIKIFQKEARELIRGSNS